jgi:RalA-binding protein 1
MADNKLRRESRMAFAPEVRSFLSLAESPRAGSHQIPPVPQRSVSVPTPTPAVEITENNPSPGSTYSPSPAAGTKEECREVAEAPSSSKQLATMAEVEEDSAETPEVDLSSPISEGRDGASQPPARQSSLHRRAGGREEVSRGAADPARQAPLATPQIQSSEPRRSHDSQRGSEESTPRQSVDVRPSVESVASATSRPSRPLPRLSPALLSHTRLSIPHTTVYPNTSGRDVLCFIVAITVRPPNAAPVTWNVAKLFSAFIDVDTKIRAKSGKRSKDWKSMVAPLPEGKAWKDFAPSKIDQRKTALEAYLQSLLSAPLSDKSDLCEFLSTDPVQAKVFSNRKEGYLTKKAKSFGGWRTRYFVLDGSVLECYENVSHVS